MKLLVGGDPELFLRRDGKFVSATEFDIPGTKEKPHAVKKGAVQIDGTALEINIDPASTALEFSDNLKTVLNEARAFVPKDVEFVFTPVVDYEKSYFDKLPNKSVELGCNPDYSAVSGEQNPVPQPIGTMRTGSGHICLGWGGGYDPLDIHHFHDCRQMSLRLDKYFQTYSPLWDTDNRRHQLYGRGAAFRPKPFGVEFRSLSNAWVGRPELYPWIFNSVKWVFNNAVKGKEMKAVTYYEQPSESKMAARLKTRSNYIKNVFDDKTELPEFPAAFVPAPPVKYGRAAYG